MAQFRRQKIGFILQHYPLIDSKNVFDNVALPLRYGKYPKKEIKARIKQQLLALGLDHLEERWPEMLSGGEAQRVAIARALIQQPELILADEPTGSLDEASEEEILTLFKELNQQGKTVILVTHDRRVAETCHKIYYIRDGICVSSGRLSFSPTS